MTIRVLEQQDESGQYHYYAYHAHIIFHDDPEDDDFSPDNNHVVEVMAEIPSPVALATWRDPMPMELAMAAAHGAMRPAKVVDILCPDPYCGAVSTYPSNGDPEARRVHWNYNEFIGKGTPHVAMPDEDREILEKLARSEPLADHESYPITAADRLHRTVHGVTHDGKPIDPDHRASLLKLRVTAHRPITPYVANAFALESMGLPIPNIDQFVDALVRKELNG
jgi:hypothetical protein